MRALKPILCLCVVGSVSTIYLLWCCYSDSSSTSIYMQQGDLYKYDEHCFADSVQLVNYAKFHQHNLAQQHGKFLIYLCNQFEPCGGYGNRVQGITMALFFAILSNRIFLVDINQPFDINQLLHPNAIKWNWNYTNYMHISKIPWTTRKYSIIDFENLTPKWPRFTEDLYNPDIKTIIFHTNLGLSWFFKVFDDKWKNLFHDQFNITEDNNIWIYGCVIRYLFSYDTIVTDAIQKEIQELGLIPGLYVSVHFRSYLDDPRLKHPSPITHLMCGIEMASNMSQTLNKTFKVYLVTDSHKAKETAITRYPGQVLPSNVKEVHLDKDKESLYEGFIGILVNIEVAAKGAALVRSYSTFSDLIESIGQFNKELVKYPTH